MSNNTAEALDQLVVDQMFSEITAAFQADDSDQRLASMTEASAYVAGLFQEFAPTIDPLLQQWGSLIGGAALGFVRDKYGFSEYEPKVFSGHSEQRVISTYHHAGHSRGVVRDMFRYAVAANHRRPGTYTDADFMNIPIIGGFHDTVMGNGRGSDERQSGKFAIQYLRSMGFTLAEGSEIQVATEASTWDEKKMQQSYDPAKGHATMQCLMCVGDHMSTLDERGPYVAITLAPEDLCRAFNNRVFVEEAAAAGFSLEGADVESCLAFMDSRPVLRARFGAFLERVAGFFATFQPADPELEAMFPLTRSGNVQHMKDMHTGYTQKGLSALGTLTLSRAYMLG